MIKYEEFRFRKKDYKSSSNVIKTRRIRINELDLFTIKKFRYELNESKFKSELWFRSLLNNSFLNYKIKCFVNYPVLNKYFIDFYFKELSIGVEVDGSSHIGKQDYDKNRDKLINSIGIKVFRVKAYDINSANLAIKNIIKSIKERKPALIKKHKPSRKIIKKNKSKKRMDIINSIRESELLWSLGKGKSPYSKI